MRRHIEPYQRFINLVLSTQGLSDFPYLAPSEERILTLLCTYWHQEKTIQVVQAMRFTNELSSATIFRCLKILRHKGYIKLVTCEVDNRIKYITPTDMTNRYFEKMGELIVEASK